MTALILTLSLSAPTIITWQDPITLTAPQRSALGSYVGDAFPASVPSATTTLGVSRTGPGPNVRAVLWEEGTVTAAQFLAMKQAGQKVTIVPGTISGGSVDVIRRTDGSGCVPVPAEPEANGCDLSDLRALVVSIFGLSAGDVQNIHAVSFQRSLGSSVVTGQVYWRRTVTGQQWIDLIDAGQASGTLYPHEID